MAGELTPMPLAEILGGVGYKTAMGAWPPGFDEAHALLTLVNLTERMRMCIVAHHDADKERLGPLFDITVDNPCAICLSTQDATAGDVLTDLKLPTHVVSIDAPDGDGYIVAHCLCGWENTTLTSAAEAQAAAQRHLEQAEKDPRDA